MFVKWFEIINSTQRFVSKVMKLIYTISLFKSKKEKTTEKKGKS